MTTTTNETRRPERKRTGQLSGVQIMFAAILAIGLLLAINFSSRITASQPLEDAERRVQEEIDALRAEQAELIQERDYVMSDAYIEKWARDEGKMVREGEFLIIPVPAGSNVQETPVPQLDVPVETTLPEPEPWMLWWSLFFDTAPPRF
jgi:cell division protein FtsB